MRFLLRATLPTDVVNEVMHDEQFMATIQRIMDDIKPEAAYFTLENGARTAYVVVDLPDAASMVKVCEPFYQSLSADVELMLVMGPEDLPSAGAHLDAALKLHG